ncbi:unnamed protein product [Effrenium voratum]|nr:unnamed protein product [Effrenium voratum]
MATSRRTAILAEAFRPEKATPFFSKDARIRDLLCDALNEAKDPLRSYLEELDWAHFNMLIDAFRPHEVPAGACIIKQGQLVEDFKPGLFVLEAGELEAWKADPSGLKEARVQTYRQPGCVFGELAVLHQAPRAASVDAVKDSKIWSVSRQTVVKTTRSFQEARRRYYDSKLQMVELLQPLGKEQRQQVIECLRSRDYKAGDMIIREGDEGHEFFLLFDGRASAIQETASSSKDTSPATTSES